MVPYYVRTGCTKSTLLYVSIPLSFKWGIFIPVYRDKGRDPLLMNSYRGITLTSVFAKVFDWTNQTRREYPANHSNSIQRRHLLQRLHLCWAGGCDKVCGWGRYCIFMLLWPSQCVRHYQVLLEQLFNAGECWEYWFCDVTSQLRLGNHLPHW